MFTSPDPTAIRIVQTEFTQKKVYMLTIVMYHYVRDLTRSRYPAIKARDTAKFAGQLDYIAKHYVVVSLAEVYAAIRGEKTLPQNACVLSFDDGFIDHYITVFPRLQQRGWTGCFFPAALPAFEHAVLDVHKIHFILAATKEPQCLVRRVFELLTPYRGDHDLPADEVLYEKLAKPSRFDPAEIVFLKSVLQRDLPEVVRTEIVDTLFCECVSEHETAFAKELYMDIEQMQLMARLGMEFGGHGFKHIWLTSLSEEEQTEEINKSLELLRLIYQRPVREWAISYPYGDYNQVTVKLLLRYNCMLGLTTVVGLVPTLSSPFELARLDTNDLPCSNET